MAPRYRVEFSPAAYRQFSTLPRTLQRRVGRRIEGLQDNPHPSDCVKLHGMEDLFRIRVGDHRILYTVKGKTLVVLVLKIAHRKEVYRRL